MAETTQEKMPKSAPVQRVQKQAEKPAAGASPSTAMSNSDRIMNNISAMSGLSMDDVSVHYNSSKPSSIGALAYTQGTDIHIAPGQEKHLAHEAWHVAQQMQGRVTPTTEIGGMGVNDSSALEQEADVMGYKASSGSFNANPAQLKKVSLNSSAAPVQGMFKKRDINPSDKLEERASGKTKIDDFYRSIEGQYTDEELTDTYHYMDMEYRKSAELYEARLGKAIERDSMVNAQADILVNYVKQIFESWLASLNLKTEEKKKKAYEDNFSYSYNYYGDFEGNMKNIRDIFDNASKQPLRLKYGLLYKCARNGALSKWLHTLAIQHHKAQEAIKRKDMAEQAKKKKSPKKATVSDVSPKDLNLTVSSEDGTYNVSGDFYKKLSKGGKYDVLNAIGEKHLDEIYGRMPADRIKEEGRVASVDLKKSSISSFDRNLSAGMMDIRDNSKAGYTKADRRFLQASEVDDLTFAEAQLLVDRKDQGEGFGQGSTDRHKAHKRQKKDLAGPRAAKAEVEAYMEKAKTSANAKIEWQQGSEDGSLINGTVVTKEANDLKARMEAGVSGSTVIMMKSFEWFGLTQPEKQVFRLGLAGWMMAARDHSFYEVFKSAESMGIPFNTYPDFVGGEYQDKDNLMPMNLATAESLCPGNHFPSYYYSLDFLKSALRVRKKTASATVSIDKDKLGEGSWVQGALSGLGIEYLFPKLKPQERYNKILESLPYFDEIYRRLQEISLIVGPLVQMVDPDSKDKELAELPANYGQLLHTFWELKRDFNYVQLANTVEMGKFTGVLVKMAERFGNMSFLVRWLRKDANAYAENVMNIESGWQNAKDVRNGKKATRPLYGGGKLSMNEDVADTEKDRLDDEMREAMGLAKQDTREAVDAETEMKARMAAESLMSQLSAIQAGRLRAVCGKAPHLLKKYFGILRRQYGAYKPEVQRIYETASSEEVVAQFYGGFENPYIQWLNEALYGDGVRANWLFANLPHADFVNKSEIDVGSLKLSSFPGANTDENWRNNVSRDTVLKSNAGLMADQTKVEGALAKVEEIAEHLLRAETELKSKIKNDSKPDDKNKFINNFIFNTFFKIPRTVKGDKADSESLNPAYTARVGFITKYGLLSAEQITFYDKAGTLSGRETGAIFLYTGDSYERMIQAFDTIPKENLNEGRWVSSTVAAVASGLVKLPVYAAAPVYRVGSWLSEGAEAGKIMSYNHPLSTAKTVNSNYISHKFPEEMDTVSVISNIKTGHDIQGMSNNFGEQEVLFEPGVQLRVIETGYLAYYNGPDDGLLALKAKHGGKASLPKYTIKKEV